MTYTVQQLSALTGLTPRTLRYYDSIGLLRPARQPGNDYRCYAEEEVARLWRILRYREMGLPLEEIGRLLEEGEDRSALERHLHHLMEQQRRITAQMERLRAALAETEEPTMDFETMKKQALEENEARYGEELREKYGEEVITESNRRFAAMSEREWKDAARAERACLDKLKEAMEMNDPACPAAMEACAIHWDWLGFYWSAEMRTPEAHRGLVEMYDQDERFRAYYEKKVGEGCAAFFARAIACYYEK